MRDYVLTCTLCGQSAADDGSRLTCPAEHAPALLRTTYREREFRIANVDSMLRYGSWLPAARPISTAARTGIYRSTALGSHLGLQRLWIAFSGWWPQRGATLPTGTFKDLEAVSVVRRLDRADTRTLVVSSAGNTALAFARVCSDNDVPALIVVPLRGWNDVMGEVALGPTVRVIAIEDGTYEHAIAFAKTLCASGEYILEGGVLNVGRRDGMGTAMLAAVEEIGRLPDYYVQAVGSAAGALAAYEASLRLIADGYGTRVPALLLGQNDPFTPIHDAWQQRSPTLVPRSPDDIAGRIGRVGAFVLSNAAPPYAICGGVREALAASGGTTFAVTNERMGNAMSLFAELEGVAIEPAAGVAVASLMQAVAAGRIAPDATVVLHVTGGGRRAIPPARLPARRPALVVSRAELETTALDRTRSLLR